MGPKVKQVVEVVPLVGAKISTVSIGSNDLQVSYKVNLNCPLDIVLDFIKKQFVSNFEQKIREIENKIQEVINEESNNSNSNSSSINNLQVNNEKEKLLEIQQKYIRIKKNLQEENVTTFELFEGGNCLYCQQVSFYSLCIPIYSFFTPFSFLFF